LKSERLREKERRSANLGRVAERERKRDLLLERVSSQSNTSLPDFLVLFDLSSPVLGVHTPIVDLGRLPVLDSLDLFPLVECEEKAGEDGADPNDGDEETQN